MHWQYFKQGFCEGGKMKTLGALFLGMGVGYMNMANCLKDWWLIMIPFGIGLFFIGIDLFYIYKEEKK